jgi:squalene synthase HpnC
VTAAPEPELAADYAQCARIARHAENFPVASRLLPASMRPHLAAIYAFARGADDLADEVAPHLGERLIATDAAARLAALDEWEAGLDGRVPAGAEPVFRALAATRRECSLPDDELRALLAAFRYDVRHQGYATWEELLAYARNSAAAIGRLVLAVAGARDESVTRESDELCVALQLTNFWQDLSRDVPLGRLTIPEGLWKSKTLDGTRLRALTGSPVERWKALKEPERTRLSSALAICVERTEAMYEHTRGLPSRAGRPLASYLGAVWIGGHTVLDRVRELGEDTFLERPALSWTDRAAIAWRAVVTRA